MRTGYTFRSSTFHARDLRFIVEKPIAKRADAIANYSQQQYRIIPDAPTRGVATATPCPCPPGLIDEDHR
jgi:hypothetical protein